MKFEHGSNQKIWVMLILGIMIYIFSFKFGYADNRTIRIAFNCHAVPYHFIDENDNYAGMHIEMMNWIAKQKKIDIIYIPYETNGDCFKAIKQGAVDLVLGHRTNDSAAIGLQYTDELSSSSLSLFAKNELNEVLGNGDDYRAYSVAIEYGTAANSYMTNIGVQRFLTQGNQVQVFQALIDKKADMALSDYIFFRYMLDKKELKDEYIALRSYISPVSYAMLVKPEDMDLFNIIDAGLKELRASGSYESIYDRWVIKDNGYFEAQLIKRIKNTAIGIAFTALVIIIASFMMNRMLQIKVEDKTKELNAINRELDKRMIQLESESKTRYGMIEFAPSGMVLFSKEYKAVLMNRAALQLGNLEGYDENSDVRTMAIFGDIIKGINGDLFSEGGGKWNAGNPSIIELDCTKSKRSFRYNVFRLYDEAGISNVLLNVEDVTKEELKKQELIEREKNKSLNRLIAGIAHEIKNPLMSIRTAASLLKDQVDNPEVQEAFIRFVPNEVDRINQLIESLINYARPIKGQRELLSLSTVVSECLYLTNIVVKKDKIKFAVDIDDNINILINKDRIKQSIINVIINGIESMERKLQTNPDAILTMKISVKGDDNFAIISIYDEGLGMSKKDILRCTEPFFTTKEWGTGLGLSLVQQFMANNNGMLSVQSEKDCYTEVVLKFWRYDMYEAKNIDN